MRVGPACRAWPAFSSPTNGDPRIRHRRAARQRGIPDVEGALREARLAPRARSAEVLLDHLGGADGGVVRVLAELALRVTLAKQVPALVEPGLDFPEARALVVAPDRP